MTDMPPHDRRPIPARKNSVIRRFAATLDRTGVTPNQISVFGFLAAVAAGSCLALTNGSPSGQRFLFLAAGLLIVVRGLSNMFDGMVAVELGRGTPSGALYNDIPDRFSDVAIFVGAGYAAGGIPWLGFGAALAAVLVAYVRVASRLAGAPSDFGGFMAKQQRMFSLAVVAAWLALAPEAWHLSLGAEEEFGLVSLCLAAILIGGTATVAVRWRRAIRYLARSADE